MESKPNDPNSNQVRREGRGHQDGRHEEGQGHPEPGAAANEVSHGSFTRSDYNSEAGREKQDLLGGDKDLQEPDIYERGDFENTKLSKAPKIIQVNGKPIRSL